MRAFLWTIAVLVAVLGVVCFVAWLNYDGLQLRHRVIRIAPTTNVDTTQHDPVSSKFRVGERVLHNEFGKGTVVATDGPKLTIAFDDGGMQRRVLESFVIKSDDPRPAK